MEDQKREFTGPYGSEVTTLFTYKNEAQEARRRRIETNRENFDCFHHRQDWSHKIPGQSKEFLAKQSISTEQTVAYLKQGLIESGDWFVIEDEPGVSKNPENVSADDMKKITMGALDDLKLPVLIDDCLKLGLLGSLMIVKISGKFTKTLSKVSVSPDKKSIIKTFSDYWGLDIYPVRQEDFFIDPTGRGLYEMERISVDWHSLKAIAESEEGYDLKVIDGLMSGEDTVQRFEKARETDQTQSYANESRKQIVLYELWGTILEPATGRVLHDNCQFIVSEDGQVVMPPRPNKFWHQSSPFVSAPILRVPKSVWHRAVMDSPTLLNKAQNEAYNLMFDNAMMSIHGIKQIRTDWLEDPDEVANGIPPGMTLRANSTMPPGSKLLENVYMGVPGSEAKDIFAITDREILSASFSNDIRAGGIPGRSVKATEVVSANQSITTVFNGITRAIEDDFMKVILEKGWLTIAQHITAMDPARIKTLIGETRGLQIFSKSAAEVFSETALGKKFKVFGLSTTLNKMSDYRKITALLQTIGVSPDMMQAFAQKYSMNKLLGEVIKSLDINEDKIKASEEELMQAQQQAQLAMAQKQADIQSTQSKKAPGQNQQSQIPQAGNTSEESGVNVDRGGLMRGGAGGAAI